MKKRFVSILHKAEDYLGFFAIFLLALIPAMEAVARLFRTSISYATPYTQHLLLLVAFITAMITSRKKMHLSLSLQLNIKEPIKTRIHTGIIFLSVLITTGFAWSSAAVVFEAFAPSLKIGIFPIRLVGMVMVIGYTVMAIRFFNDAPKTKLSRAIILFGFLLGTFMAMSSIESAWAAIIGDTPQFITSLTEASQSMNSVIGFPLILTLIAAAILGAPLFVVLGGIGYLLFAAAGNPTTSIPYAAYSMLTDTSIVAIPLFTVAGFLLSESKASDRLVRFFKAAFGWMPGGVAIMAILVCTFFTTFTGASGVTILALGALLAVALGKSGYEKKFNEGLLVGSGSVGLLFPPSLPIIIYGVVAGVSIKKMFVGGILPGFVMIAALVGFSIYYASKNKIKREPFKLKEILSTARESIWELLLPVVILLAFFGGITNLMESAALAVIYALIIEVAIHKDLKIKDLPGVLSKCMPIIGGILIILSMARGLQEYIIDAEVPAQLLEWVQANIHSKYIFLLLLNIFLLITGCLMDIFSAIMVVVPLIIPLGIHFGIHPVHLGIIFLANMELGYMTPPVGLNLFLASYRFNEPMGKLYRAVIPFFLIQLIAVLLITYVPFFSTAFFEAPQTGPTIAEIVSPIGEAINQLILLLPKLV